MQDRLNAATDQLYGARPAEFVALRARLEREARAAGEADQGAAIGRLRKPTLAAWTLNQLSRLHRRDVDLLLDAGHRLRQTQAAVSTDSRSEFEQARRRERDAIQTLTAAARSLLRQETGHATPALVNEIGDALRAAAGSEEAREHLARGTFVKPIRPPSGFELLAGSTPPTATRTAARRGQAQQVREAVKEARAAHRTALREHDARELEARDAERDAKRLRTELEQAEENALRARRAAADAAKTLAGAERSLESAERRRH